MRTRKQIFMAVAEGCTNRRQIAHCLGRPLSTINSHFYDFGTGYVTIKNGGLLQWEPRLGNTLRLGRLAAVVYGPDGKVKDVMQVDGEFKPNAN